MSRPELTEEELRQIEAEMERITVDDVLIQTLVTLLNLAARKAGLADQAREPDWEQVRQGIEGARALVPLLEQRHGDKLGPIRDTLSQLQMVYAQKAAGQAPPEPAAEEPEKPEQQGPGPAQSSGRLWVPGQ